MAVPAAPAPCGDVELSTLLSHWGVCYAGARADIALAGSPQRCLARHAVEDTAGRLYVLESVPRGRSLIKARIAEALAYLSDRGLARINPYLRLPSGEYLLRDQQRLWQLAPYVAGCALERPAYVHDDWRGAALGRFLLDLRRTAVHVPAFSDTEAFDLRRFVRHLEVRLRGNEPAVLERLTPALQLVADRLFPGLCLLPTAFCHGDVHALNVIWSANDIAAVIDWEFAGYKTEAYDLAVLLGCVGIEEPSGLRGALVRRLLETLRSADYITPASWALLPELVISSRLIWLSEWLRNRDGEMVGLELSYIDLLLGIAGELRSDWSSDGV